jgi:hypothetical protein
MSLQIRNMLPFAWAPRQRQLSEVRLSARPLGRAAANGGGPGGRTRLGGSAQRLGGTVVE